MNDAKKVWLILASIALMFVLPIVGAFIYSGGHIPQEIFIYPATEPLAKASFNPYIFALLSLVFVAFVLLYAYPKIYGFKKEMDVLLLPDKRPKLPFWFWIGLVIWSVSLFLLWGRFDGMTWYYKYIDIQLWWSFAAMLDGWAYTRNYGDSLMGTRPRELIGIAVASVMGWMIFEYFNFFVNRNWYYPEGSQIPPVEFFCYSMFASTSVFPISFEFYSLFNTFPVFKDKYTQGPKIVLPAWVKTSLFIISFSAMFILYFFPNETFFLVWFAPLIIFALLLSKFEIWTPFTPLKNGNWSPLLLIALSWVASGFFVECWNYFSGSHTDGVLATNNTLYWAYSVPFVNVAHLFEMPILGYMGYLPYGVYAGIWWLTFAFLLNIPTQFAEKGHHNV